MTEETQTTIITAAATLILIMALAFATSYAAKATPRDCHRHSTTTHCH